MTPRSRVRVYPPAVKIDRCTGCARTMPIRALKMCNTCYNNRYVASCENCSMARRLTDGLCERCIAAASRSPCHSGAELPDFYGPRVPHTITPRPRPLRPHEHRALADIHTAWRR